ncbi:hypothetical protein [Dactylosporangium sp. NPDC051541]|uniref:DUF7489 domain-containing protein n=1 Tax=Dactylosporangium sp. NPDC051541 TaxID=3363977 RepID=UPI0037A626B1
MTKSEAAWSGTVAKKSRAMFDGSNLYRRLEVRLDDGSSIEVKVDRELWRELQVGDRLAQEAGGRPHRG